VPVKVVAVYNARPGRWGSSIIPTAVSPATSPSSRARSHLNASTADAKTLEPTLATAGLKLDDEAVVDSTRVPLFVQTPGSFSPALRPAICCAPAPCPGRYVAYAKYGLIACSTGLVVGTALMESRPTCEEVGVLFVARRGGRFEGSGCRGVV
jgi:hypothetical protein